MSDTQQWRNDTIANVSWETGAMADLVQEKVAAAHLALHMKQNHPGRRYRIVRELTPDGRFEALLAVPLDG